MRERPKLLIFPQIDSLAETTLARGTQTAGRGGQTREQFWGWLYRTPYMTDKRVVKLCGCGFGLMRNSGRARGLRPGVHVEVWWS